MQWCGLSLRAERDLGELRAERGSGGAERPRGCTERSELGFPLRGAELDERSEGVGERSDHVGVPSGAS